MDRRDFIKASGSGLALVAAVLAGGTGALAAEDGVARRRFKSPDPESLAKAVYKSFIPGEKTCGEAMLLGCCEELQIESGIIPDIALGMGGGIGMQGEACGIVTGATMVIGMVVGSREEDYKKRKMRVFSACGQFLQRFQKEQRTLSCRAICDLDLTTPEGREKLNSGVKAGKCAPVIQSAARMLAEVLKEDEEHPSYIPPRSLGAQG